MARRQARDLAFRTLFQAERGHAPLLDVWEHAKEELAQNSEENELEEVFGEGLNSEALSFADKLIQHYHDHQQAIDEELEAAIEGWTFTQMAQTDLNVLRLALAEFRLAEVPKEVSIEMAIRLAKKYGGEESGRFVNGVLAQIIRRREAIGA
ncbi:MAG: transcription antitermination factor NusB [Trueperaceae bacterium]|nr:transcription antitermination factor NusB [Trueperaceae bacterium]